MKNKAIWVGGVIGFIFTLILIVSYLTINTPSTITFMSVLFILLFIGNFVFIGGFLGYLKKHGHNKTLFIFLATYLITVVINTFNFAEGWIVAFGYGYFLEYIILAFAIPTPIVFLIMGFFTLFIFVISTLGIGLIPIALGFLLASWVVKNIKGKPKVIAFILILLQYWAFVVSLAGIFGLLPTW